MTGNLRAVQPSGTTGTRTGQCLSWHCLSEAARYSTLCASLVILIVAIGCGGGGGGTIPSSAVGPNIYLTEGLGAGHTSSILVIPTTANGTVSPSSTLMGPAGVFFTGVAVDGAGNVYVGAETF